MLEKVKAKLPRKKSVPLEWDLRSTEGGAVPDQELPEFDADATPFEEVSDGE